MSNATNYYLLGAAVQSHDPDGRKFTPVCLSNLLNIPSRAAVVLRHEWGRMQSGRCGELLDRIEWDMFRPDVGDSGSFWIGFYHERSRAKDPDRFRSINPSAADILDPEIVIPAE